MDQDTMRQRVSEARVGRLATVTPEGRPHLVPCCFVLDGQVVYSAVDAKPKSTLALRRLANVRAHPAAGLLVDHYAEDWTTLWWVRLDGDARVVDAPPPDPALPPPMATSSLHRLRNEHEHALDRLAAKYPQYRHRRPPGPVLALTVTTWRAWP